MNDLGLGIFAYESLAGEPLRLVEVEDGLWKVYFANLVIGVLDQEDLKRHKTCRVLPMSRV